MTALYFLVAVFVIYFALSSIALGPVFYSALTGEDYFLLCVARGDSMYPYIEDGDYLIVDPTPEQITEGEILVYRKDNTLIGHRVISITSSGFILKGDNNYNPDPWVVSKAQVVGEVERVLKDPISKKIAELWFKRFN